MPKSLTLEIVKHKTNSSDISKVERINLWGLDLSDISILSQATSLKLLSLTSNKISSLAPLSNCHSLTELYLRKNKVESFDEVSHLKNLENLRILWLSENPCSKIENYRLRVIKELPNLYKLDDVEITPDERQMAFEMKSFETINSEDVNSRSRAEEDRPASAILKKNAQNVLLSNRNHDEMMQNAGVAVGRNKWKKKNKAKKVNKWKSKRKVEKGGSKEQVNIANNQMIEIQDELDKLQERYSEPLYQEPKAKRGQFDDHSKLKMISIISDNTQALSNNRPGLAETGQFGKAKKKVDEEIDAVLGDIVPNFSNKYKSIVVLLGLLKLDDLQYIQKKIA